MLQNYRFSGTFKTVTLTTNVNKQDHTTTKLITIQTILYNYTYILYNNINNHTILQTTIHNNNKQ